MKQGFTLIELLAVIAILAIIAIIATPIIINIIDDTKKSSTLRSSELYMSAVELAIAKAETDNIDITTCTVDDNNLKCGEEQYEIKIDGEIPEEVEIRATKEGEVNAVIKINGYCIIKKEDGYSYKKVVDRVNDDEKEITNNMCALNPYTSENCFTFDSSTGTITKYYSYENNNNANSACPKDVVIPNKINGVDVKIIGDKAFEKKNLTSVIMPDEIINIGVYAFANNFLENLKLPKGYFKLGVAAFAKNSLPRDQAFIYKRNEDGSIDYSTIIAYGGLEKDNIIIPSEKNGIKLTTIGSQAFDNQGIKGLVIPEGITKISSGAFQNNLLTEIEIPNSVVTIEEFAFQLNYIKSVILSDSVKSIGNRAFNKNKIENLKLPKGYFKLGVAVFAKNSLPQDQAYIYKRNEDGSIDYSTIIAYGGLEKDNIIIPSEKNGVKLTTIDIQAFDDQDIKGVVIPNTVTWIKKWAFVTNPLTSVIIKNKKENVTIGNNAFGSFDVNNIVWDYVEE